MPRQPKPYFRKQTKSWYFSTDGKQHNLGTDRTGAFEKFHEMMLSKDTLKSSAQTLYELSQAYLDWCEQPHLLISRTINQRHWVTKSSLVHRRE